MDRLLGGTRANCEALGVPGRFDERLTRRWSTRIADVFEADDPVLFDAFVRSHPELLRSDLLGRPRWRAAG
jgi:hypothetical protein